MSSPLNFFTDPAELAPKPRRGKGKPRGSSLAVDLLGCNACGLFKRCHSPKMEPYGQGKMGIMVIGESPGEEEDETGIPFVGKTGKYVAKMLRGMGVSLDDDCLRTNALQCFPGDKSKIPQAAYQACHIRLDKQIKEFKPKLVLAFGEPAVSAMFQKFANPGSLAMHGRVIPCQEYHAWVSCSFHPSYMFRKNRQGDEYTSEDLGQLLYESVKLGLDHLEIPFREPLDPKDYEDYTGRAEVAIQFLTELTQEDDKGDWVSIDYETTALSPFTTGFQIASVSLFDPYRNNGKAGFIPIDHVEAKWTGMERAGIIMALQKFLTSSVPKIIQNYAFEEIVTRKVFGIEVNNVVADTMVDSHLLDQRKGTTNLDFQVFQYAGVQYKGMVDPTKIAQTPLPRLGMYNALDARYTYFIHSNQQERMPKSMWPASDLFLHGTHALVDLHERGVKIDMAEMDKQEQACTKELETSLKAIDTSGLVKEGFNPSSDTEVIGVLQRYGVKWDAKTDSGKPSVDAKALQAIMVHPDTKEEVAILIRHLLRYSKLDKMNSTYYKGIRDWVYPDGLLHPHYLLNIARSFRSSAVDPNMQNFPHRDEEGKLFRRVVVPHIGDWLLEVDMSSFEVRGIAMLSGDENLVAQVKAHWDFHRYWGSRIYEITEAKVTKQQRYLSKNQFVFPNFYGCQPATPAAGLNQPLEKMEALCHDFWEMYPGVREWQRKLLQEYKRTARVAMPFGFVRIGPLTKNQIINTPVQGMCFHLELDGIIRANEEMKAEKLRSAGEIEVHDSLTIDTVDAEIEAVMAICNKHLTSERFDFQAGVPLEVEWSMGRNWCDMEDLSK